MPRSRIALVLLFLTALAGCATPSTASRRARSSEAPEVTPPTRQASASERKTPVVAASKPAPKAVEPVSPPRTVETAEAPTPPRPLSDAQAEFFCGPGGALERRTPTERPAGVVAFEPRMTRPEKLSGPQPFYTQQALEQNIQGQMLARCILTREGTVRSCRILKPLPVMDEEVLLSLCSSRYTPALDGGQPVDVEYTFNVRLAPP